VDRVVEERYVEPHVQRRLFAGATVLVVVGFTAFSFLLVSVLTHSGFELLDRPVEIGVVVVLVVWIIAARHLWRPILLFGGMVTGVILAQILAPIVRHPRPPIGLMLFGPDRTFSFRSGHVLGTSDFLLILAFLRDRHPTHCSHTRRTGQRGALTTSAGWHVMWPPTVPPNRKAVPR
jgi:membrane-associated phospholipid phosphatase